MGGFHKDSPDAQKIRERTQTLEGSADYRLLFDEQDSASGSFSFLVIGDSGVGKDGQHRVARALNREIEKGDIAFILHTGDVIYSYGEARHYPDRFVKPYAKLLADGARSTPTKMRFRVPFLPVYGNHDYYDRSFGSGSRNGTAFEEAFVQTDPSKRTPEGLPYLTGTAETRIPNRYYWFTYGPCAFIALDSNTLDHLRGPDDTKRPDWEFRLKVAKLKLDYLKDLAAEFDEAVRDDLMTADEADAELCALLDSEEESFDDELLEADKDYEVIRSGLKEKSPDDFDSEQIEWLKRVLAREDIKSRFKILYLHHPFYSSESAHTGETGIKGLRSNLVTQKILADDDIRVVLAGHSHCFEFVRSLNPDLLTTSFVTTGGGGRGLRGSVLQSSRQGRSARNFLEVARSMAFAKKHHFLKVDVSAEGIEIRPIEVAKSGRTAALPVLTPRSGGTLEDQGKRLQGVRVPRDGSFELSFTQQ